jgi:DNA polymerase
MRLDEDYLRELELWSCVALTSAISPGSKAAGAAQSAIPVAAVDPLAAQGARTDVVKREPPAQRATTSTRPVASPVTAVTIIAPRAQEPQRAAAIATLDMDGLQRETAGCKACGLCLQRKQAVLGVGPLNAPWLLVGEGPGAEEDAQGEPFVGPAGKLLDAMLAATGLARGREVYIANVVKCRPPGNRTPTLDEAAACAPFLDRQIELIQPRLIIALGKTAVLRLTGSDAGMASLRGRLHDYRGITVVATYHPAYLLRNPPDKLKAWEDLQLARAAMAAMGSGSGFTGGPL